jgi:transcriptional regulator with XRE-family HTH domain
MVIPKYARELKAARLRCGLTQKQAAALCGISERMLLHYEKGNHRPKAAHLAGMMMVLDSPQPLR